MSEKDKLDADEQRKYSATVVVGGDGLPLLFLLLLFLASVTGDILFAGLYKRERERSMFCQLHVIFFRS